MPVDVMQLQRRDPQAWTAFFSHTPPMDDAVVTAVTSEPLWTASLATRQRIGNAWSQNVSRYAVSISGCSDPISFIGKRTNAIEARIYQLIAPHFPKLFAPNYYVHLAGDESWLVLADVPNNYPPHRRVTAMLDSLLEQMATYHAAFWGKTLRPQNLLWLPPYLELDLEDAGTVSFDDRRNGNFDGQHLLSQHALECVGALAPAFREAERGLLALREIGGWPDVISDNQLAAAADLLDDPMPIIAALRELPGTLIHTDPHSYHWLLTVFDEAYLMDWSGARFGPGVMDLMAYLERYPLLYSLESTSNMWTSGESPVDVNDVFVRPRDLSPLLEETLIDSYLLAMSSRLGSEFSAREFRQALPAARCLYVLTTWLPYIASWDGLPDISTWKQINSMDELELVERGLGQFIGVRAFMAGVFDRFLAAYRSL